MKQPLHGSVPETPPPTRLALQARTHEKGRPVNQQFQQQLKEQQAKREAALAATREGPAQPGELARLAKVFGPKRTNHNHKER